MTSNVKQLLSGMVPQSVWCYLREKKIVHRHRQVAEYCESLCDEYFSSSLSQDELPIRALKEFGTEKIVWQYWAQGYDEVPEVVRQCLKSIDRYKGEYLTIRIDDDNIHEYIELPPCLQERRAAMSFAHYSDMLRLCLLYAYGGIWMDATIFMSGAIPEELRSGDFFVYRRDPDEKHKDYWKNTYAYYFGWAKGFRVNMLNSIIYSRRKGEVISVLCGIMLFFWKSHTEIPDYFFFQILFDVLSERQCIRLTERLSDCKPHYLQQCLNDPAFHLATKEEILRSIPIHKLTYK